MSVRLVTISHGRRRRDAHRVRFMLDVEYPSSGCGWAPASIVGYRFLHSLDSVSSPHPRITCCKRVEPARRSCMGSAAQYACREMSRLLLLAEVGVRSVDGNTELKERKKENTRDLLRSPPRRTPVETGVETHFCSRIKELLSYTLY